jgi:hypothetical protein
MYGQVGSGNCSAGRFNLMAQMGNMGYRYVRKFKNRGNIRNCHYYTVAVFAKLLD